MKLVINKDQLAIHIYIIFSITTKLFKYNQCSAELIDPEEPDYVSRYYQSFDDDAVFQFPEFDYIQSTKNEIGWKEWVAACEQTPVCLGRIDLDKLKCVRKCLSRSCYNEIYGFDELEEGEIDVRATSFKGCFTQRIQRKRHWD